MGRRAADLGSARGGSEAVDAVTLLSVDVEIVVELEGPAPVELGRLVDLVVFAAAAAGAEGRWSIAVVLTDDPRLRQLHRDFMGIDEETDVMTFPYGDGLGGDIVISVERAAEQAPEYGHGTGEEVEFLAVHGVLHLAGWEDGTAAERARMLGRQAEIIEAFRLERDSSSG
jgi:probable rRNA maturation factor